MKILVIHNTYQARGGEDVVVENETSLLRMASHEVVVEQVDNSNIKGVAEKLSAFWNAPFDQARYDWMRDLVKLHRPDVVHIHNFFPLLTPAIHQAASEAGAAVVQTLHNFRTVCASAMLMRDGKICEKCLSGDRYWGVIHRCYRGSAVGSLAVVRMQRRADSAGIWHRHVHRFVTLSEFSKRKFVEGGLPPDRLAVKPNFVDAPTLRSPPLPRTQVVFLGRLSQEKGIATLLEAWQHLPDIPLTIAGDGPEAGALRAGADVNINFVGSLPRAEVSALLQRAKMLVIPSVCYEGGVPLVLLEAFSHGVPVVASNIGSLGELVRPGLNGALFTAGDPDALAVAVRSILANPETLAALGKGARTTYENYYTPPRNLGLLEDIYTQAIETAKNSIREDREGMTR